MLPLNRHRNAAITAKAATWLTVQESRDSHLKTTHDTLEGVQKLSMNETGLSSPFNRKPHAIDQDVTEFNINANHFQLLDRKCRLLCRPANYLCGAVPVRRPAVNNHCARLP